MVLLDKSRHLFWRGPHIFAVNPFLSIISGFLMDSFWSHFVSNKFFWFSCQFAGGCYSLLLHCIYFAPFRMAFVVILEIFVSAIFDWIPKILVFLLTLQGMVWSLNCIPKTNKLKNRTGDDEKIDNGTSKGPLDRMITCPSVYHGLMARHHFSPWVDPWQARRQDKLPESGSACEKYCLGCTMWLQDILWFPKTAAFASYQMFSFILTYSIFGKDDILATRWECIRLTFHALRKVPCMHLSMKDMLNSRSIAGGSTTLIDVHV